MNSGRFPVKHGMSKPRHPIYRAWIAMHDRTANRPGRNPTYAGVTVCDEWSTFEGFLVWAQDTWAPGHELDRIDPHGNYRPDNCRWATDKQQARNRRDNRLVTIGQETYCVAEWIERLGVTASTVYHRIYQKNWDPARALTTPIGRYTRRKSAIRTSQDSS